MANGRVSTASIARTLSRLQQRLALLVGTLALVAVILACSTIAKLSVAPASTLSIGITFTDEGAPPPGTVWAYLSFSDGKQSVALSGGQQLTCDGVDLLHQNPLIKRQPPGGTYTCVYTDERGTQTTFSILEPTGSLTITSPRAGAKVPIPWQDLPPPYYETPTATPAAPVVHDPFTIAYTIPESPAKQQTFTSIDAIVYGCASGTQTPPPSCNEEREGVVAEARDTALTQAGNLRVSGVPVHQSNGYDSLFPGPGRVDMFLNMSWLIAPQGFRSIGVTVRERVTTKFTWVAAK